MIQPWRALLVVLSLVLMPWFGAFLRPALAGTASPTLTCDPCEEEDRFVRLHAAQESRAVSPGQYAHPLVLSPQEWATLLTALRVQRQAEGLLFRDPPGPVLPAFSSEEIGYLSVALSQAFARASPNEWVAFGMSRSNRYGMTEVTTGEWFVDGTSLHFLLANYRKVVTMSSTRQLLWDRPGHPDAGPAYDLVPGPHQMIVRDSNAWTGLFSTAPSELSLLYQAALLAEPADAQTTQQAHPSSSDVIPPTPSLEERLSMLKRWHDQGLITDEDYRAKKQQLLDRL